MLKQQWIKSHWVEILSEITKSIYPSNSAFLLNNICVNLPFTWRWWTHYRIPSCYWWISKIMHHNQALTLRFLVSVKYAKVLLLWQHDYLNGILLCHLTVKVVFNLMQWLCKILRFNCNMNEILRRAASLSVLKFQHIVVCD